MKKLLLLLALVTPVLAGPTAIEWFTRAAEQGDTISENDLQRIGDEESSPEQNNLQASGNSSADELNAGMDAAENGDYKAAVSHWTKSAEQGNVFAQYNLGIIYLYGKNGIETDVDAAIGWFKNAFANGHIGSGMELGKTYLFGWGVPINTQEAIKWFLADAERGFSDAHDISGELLFSDRIDQESTRQIILDWLNVSAGEGNPRSQYYLGLFYLASTGIHKDLRLAHEWLQKSADHGDPEAQVRLAEMYANGHGTTRNFVESLRYYTLSAEQGNVDAYYGLGLIHYAGDGTPRDIQEAIRWFEKAATGGHELAQFNLGALFISGKHVSPKFKVAYEWFRKAAEQGNIKAQYNMGTYYLTGQNIPKDLVIAYGWFLKAAEQGESNAQFNVGLMHLTGKGGFPVDRHIAKNWFSRSASAGNAQARIALERMEQSNSLGAILAGLVIIGAAIVNNMPEGGNTSAPIGDNSYQPINIELDVGLAWVE